jgi:hypothetical protein
VQRIGWEAPEITRLDLLWEACRSALCRRSFSGKKSAARCPQMLRLDEEKKLLPFSRELPEGKGSWDEIGLLLSAPQATLVKFWIESIGSGSKVLYFAGDRRCRSSRGDRIMPNQPCATPWISSISSPSRPISNYMKIEMAYSTLFRLFFDIRSEKTMSSASHSLVLVLGSQIANQHSPEISKHKTVIRRNRDRLIIPASHAVSYR